MKRLGFVFLFNVIAICVWLVGSKAELVKENYDVNITIEASVSEETVEEVRDVLHLVPSSIVDSFVENEWKMVMLSSFEEEEGYEYIASDGTVVGLINYTDKTIIVKGVPAYEGTAKNIAMHEMCHYIDRLWGNVSETEKFEALYDQYKNGGYITYSYAGIKVTENSATDIFYATSSNHEFFAETLKDYYMHPEYLKENYKEIYDFYRVLHINYK